jgi:hypothetical protein
MEPDWDILLRLLLRDCAAGGTGDALPASGGGTMLLESEDEGLEARRILEA